MERVNGGGGGLGGTGKRERVEKGGGWGVEGFRVDGVARGLGFRVFRGGG